MNDNAAPDAPVTGATREQIETAVRTRIKRDYPSVTEEEITVWMKNQVMTADSGLLTITQAAELLVPPGMVIAPAGDVLTATLRDDINWIISELELSQKAYGDVVPDYQIAVVSRLRKLAAGGTE